MTPAAMRRKARNVALFAVLLVVGLVVVTAPPGRGLPRPLPVDYGRTTTGTVPRAVTR